MITVLLTAIPVACIAWTVTQEEIFREMREWLCDRYKDVRLHWWQRKLAYLPTCPFCFSHYVAAMFVALFGVRFLAPDWVGAVAALFAIVAVANVYITGYQILRLVLKRLRLETDRMEAPSVPASRPRPQLVPPRPVRFPASMERGAPRHP